MRQTIEYYMCRIVPLLTQPSIHHHLAGRPSSSAPLAAWPSTWLAARVLVFHWLAEPLDG